VHTTYDEYCFNHTGDVMVANCDDTCEVQDLNIGENLQDNLATTAAELTKAILQVGANNSVSIDSSKEFCDVIAPLYHNASVKVSAAYLALPVKPPFPPLPLQPSPPPYPPLPPGHVEDGMHEIHDVEIPFKVIVSAACEPPQFNHIFRYDLVVEAKVVHKGNDFDFDHGHPMEETFKGSGEWTTTLKGHQMPHGMEWGFALRDENMNYLYEIGQEPSKNGPGCSVMRRGRCYFWRSPLYGQKSKYGKKCGIVNHGFVNRRIRSALYHRNHGYPYTFVFGTCDSSCTEKSN